MILLDTHALVWLDAGNARLGEMARQQIDTALQAGMLAVSAISFWEVAMLIAKDRLALAIDSTRWRADLLTAGLREIAVDGSIGIHAAQLANFHGDPADRLIVATAQAADATLITADRKILSWGADLPRHDARL